MVVEPSPCSICITPSSRVTPGAISLEGRSTVTGSRSSGRGSLSMTRSELVLIGGGIVLYQPRFEGFGAHHLKQKFASLKKFILRDRHHVRLLFHLRFHMNLLTLT